MKHSWLLGITLLLGSVAFAAKPQSVSLPVGHATTLALGAPVSAVKVDDPSKVEISRSGNRVTLVGVAQGSTDATVMTTDGEVKLHIYVAADKYALPY